MSRSVKELEKLRKEGKYLHSHKHGEEPMVFQYLYDSGTQGGNDTGGVMTTDKVILSEALDYGFHNAYPYDLSPPFYTYGLHLQEVEWTIMGWTWHQENRLGSYDKYMGAMSAHVYLDVSNGIGPTIDVNPIIAESAEFGHDAGELGWGQQPDAGTITPTGSKFLLGKHAKPMQPATSPLLSSGTRTTVTHSGDTFKYEGRTDVSEFGLKCNLDNLIHTGYERREHPLSLQLMHSRDATIDMGYYRFTVQLTLRGILDK